MGCSKNSLLLFANKLLYMYAQHMALGDAYTLFGGMRKRDLFGVMRKRDPVSYSVMVGGFAKVGDYMNLFGIFRAIIQCGVQLENYKMPFVIRASEYSRPPNG
jgi:hypothetical protein